MKNFIKEWLLPPKVKEYLMYKISLYQAKKLNLNVLKKNIKIKDKYKDKRCFILGNAPTINDIDILLLKDEYVFVMSTFYNHPKYKELRNTFYSSVNITGSRSDNDTLIQMKAISDNTSPSNIFFFDLKQKNIIEQNKLFLNKDVFFIATASIERSFDLSKLTQSYATNIIQTLEVAIYLGFDRKLLPLKDPNFNDNSTCKKDFFIQMETTYTVFQALKIVHNYARKHKIEIYYTNKESLLKFFEYKEFEELFNA